MLKEHPNIEDSFIEYRDFRDKMNKIKNNIRRSNGDEPRRVQWSHFYREMYNEFIKLMQPVIEARDEEMNQKLQKKDRKIEKLNKQIQSLKPERLFDMEPENK